MYDKCIKSQVVINLYLINIYKKNQQVRCDILMISYKIYETIIQSSIMKNWQ